MKRVDAGWTAATNGRGRIHSHPPRGPRINLQWPTSVVEHIRVLVKIAAKILWCSGQTKIYSKLWQILRRCVGFGNTVCNDCQCFCGLRGVGPPYLWNRSEWHGHHSKGFTLEKSWSKLTNLWRHLKTLKTSVRGMKEEHMTCSNHMESQAKVGSDLGTKNTWANSPCMDWGWIYLPGITKIFQNWPDFVFPPPNSTHLPKEEPNTFCTPQCDKMNQNSIGIHPAGGL